MRRFRMRFVGKAVLLLGLIMLMSAIVMLLWNKVAAVALDGAHPIDYWHALGLLVLCRILFGGLGGRGGGHRARHWEKWQAMTREERDAFIQRLHSSRSTGPGE